MESKELEKLVKRRHPEYEAMLPHWDFLESCYRGGRGWFDHHIFKYLKEGDGEYKDRVKRAYRFNHSREVVDLVNKYIFRVPVVRKDESPEIITDFWKATTRSKLDITSFMRQVSTASSTFGRIWVCVDNAASQAPVSRKEEKELGIRDYAYIIKPQDMLEMSFDDEGIMLWCLVREQLRDDTDPFDSTGELYYRYRLWTREGWFLIVDTNKGKRKKNFEVIKEGKHELGEVPVFKVDNVESDLVYTAPALINDIAYLDRAIANYLSNLDAIIQDQTFSQLAMPAQGILPGEEMYKKLLEMGTKRIFVYDGEHGAAPFYLSPDPKQAELVIMVAQKIINEIYHTVGMAGERTKQDNSMGIDNSSGVAKAFDFERVNALLINKADSLQRAERKMVDLVGKWNGKELDEADLVKYPETFDVRGLIDEFQVASNLSLIEAPDGVRRLQMESLIDKLFPGITEALRKELKAELTDWPPKVEPMTLGIPGDEAEEDESSDD